MYADKATETKLVNAIKEAAQRIDYSGTDDPEAILADCLLKQGLHDGFAKTAANAINKSYSVYYMSTHDDSDRDADHRLLDGDKVKVKMCKEDIPACPHTSEPVEEPVIVSIKRVSTIGKAASEDKPEYTPRTFNSDKEYLDWLANGLYKFASAFDKFYADTCGATEKIYGRHKQARDMDMDDYTVQCIMSHDHRDTNELLNTLGYTKRASKIAMFGTGKIQELPRIIPDNNTSATIFSLVRDASIVKTAHDSVNYMLKEANDLKDCLVDLISDYEYKCLTKSAAKPDTGPKYDIADAASTGIATLPSLAIGAMSGIHGGIANIIENAAQAADSNRQGVSSSSVLDTNLLKEDRRVKNLEAWAEVASDSDLARYPITDLFEVTQKILKANPQFERPDSAPMLIDTVKQVMSQGGTIGLALHGATAKTLSDIAKARGANITGNDLYGIRGTITGKKEQGQFFNVSKLFTDNMRDAATSIEKVPEAIKGISKGVIDTGIAAVKGIANAKTRAMQKELEDAKLRADIRAAKEKEEFETAHADEIKELREYNHQKKVDEMNVGKQKKLDDDANTKATAQLNQERQAVMDELTEKASVKGKANLMQAITSNPNAFITAYMADPSIVDDDNKIAILSKVPNISNSMEALDKLSQHSRIVSEIGSNGELAKNINEALGDKGNALTKQLFNNDPVKMTALFYSNTKDVAKQQAAANAQIAMQTKDTARQELAELANNDPKIMAILAQGNRRDQNHLLNTYMNNPDNVTDKTRRRLLSDVDGIEKHPELIDMISGNSALPGEVLRDPGALKRIIQAGDIAIRAFKHNPTNTLNAFRNLTQGGSNGGNQGGGGGGNQGGSPKPRVFSKGTSYGAQSMTPNDWALNAMKGRVAKETDDDDKKAVLTDAYNNLTQEQKDWFKSDFGVSSDADAIDLLHSLYNL